MIAIVPIRNLSWPANTLTLLRPPGADSDEGDTEPDHYRIAFWR